MFLLEKVEEYPSKKEKNYNLNVHRRILKKEKKKK